MTNIKWKWFLGLTVAIILEGGATPAKLFSGPFGEDLSPSEIFKKAQDKYASLTSYSDEGKITVTTGGNVSTTTFTIRLARTNFFYIEWAQTSELSYGTMNFAPQMVWSAGSGNFLERGYGPQDEDSRDIALLEAAAPSGGVAGTIPLVFFNAQFENELRGSVFEENRQADERVGDADCYVFTKETRGQIKTLWIGKQDFLIHQLRTETSAEAIRAIVGGFDPEIGPYLQRLTSIETHTNILVNKLFLRSNFLPSNGE